ncbi:MAG: hypothetical protein RLZZ511_3279 [Cyanobacteriota bacterium]|jgi:hypothetical protein
MLWEILHDAAIACVGSIKSIAVSIAIFIVFQFREPSVCSKLVARSKTSDAL